MIPFVHLHVHSQYSILDGQASIPALVDKAIADGMRGIALTDHGNMFGIKELHDYCNKKNAPINSAIKQLKEQLPKVDSDKALQLNSEIQQLQKQLFKPIFGCEMYVAEKNKLEHTSKSDTGRHLIVLAKNKTGYKNLIKIVSEAWTEGFYSHPRTDKQSIAERHEGLMICSACLGGEIPKLILSGQLVQARQAVKWWKDLLGDDYYLELQRHKATVENANHETYPAQQLVNAELIKISEELGVKLICTNDTHFVNEEDAEAHDRLICLSTGKKITDKRLLYSKQEWLKTQDEMNQLFADIPQAIANTNELLDKTEFYSIDHEPILPDFPLPAPFTDENQYLRHLVYQGAKLRWPQAFDSTSPSDNASELKERIDFELETIKNMGFPGYFLIVQDFIAAARKLGVSVGPGRGSAAGSAVAYCLGITQIDPLKYDLLFERFLNPDRISLPDIDIDFDDDGRAKVLNYVTEKYGAEKVAHIITYGTMAAKMAIKDVARVEDLSLAESDRLANFIPKRPNDMPNDQKGKKMKITISNCLKCFPEFSRELNNPDSRVGETIKYAERLEGNVRGTGVHACGVIIGRDAITDWVPVSTAYDSDGTRVLVTQYEGSVIESTGLIKMDFLGLKTLSIIKDAIANIKETHGIDIDIDHIDLNDPKTYKLYCEGKTSGTFQFESAGMQKYLIELQPSSFEDLIAMNALYRPGPMDKIPEFIKRKHGELPIQYDFPEMEKYLKDTYGITVYQEQVMLLSRQLAGFSRGQSDGLRKAMGKKLIDKLNSLKSKFIEGGQQRGHDTDKLESIWSEWEKFASYAFNKSHATCYSWVAYQTAWLKANYPSEYMAAVLSRTGDQEKLTKYMDECKQMKIEIKGPDINESIQQFGANKKGDIRFGLLGVKGIGENVVNAIIDERHKNGPFQSVMDFVERVNSSTCNRRSLEALALAGAFDCFDELKREDFLATNSKGESTSEILVRYGQTFQNEKVRQQMSLFGDDDTIISPPVLPISEPWPKIALLEKERELVGMYLSAHPLDPFYLELEYGCNIHLKDLANTSPLLDKPLTFGGLVTNFEIKTAKNGGQFGIMKLEDFTGSYDIMLFSKNFLTYKQFGAPGTALLINASLSRNKYKPDRVDLNISSIDLLSDKQGKMIHDITLTIPSERINDSLTKQLQKYSTKSTQNRADLFFRLISDQTGHSIKLQSELKMPVTKELLSFLNSCEIPFEINSAI